jgi:hypothetical protein
MLSTSTKYLPAVKPGPVLDTGTHRIVNADGVAVMLLLVEPNNRCPTTPPYF